MHNIVDVTTIRDLNDQLRQSRAGGVLVMTAGVIALGQAHHQATPRLSRLTRARRWHP